MSTTTTKLKLFKYDTVADKDVDFNINDALNPNWDKIDNAFSNLSLEITDDNNGNIQISI